MAFPDQGNIQKYMAYDNGLAIGNWNLASGFLMLFVVLFAYMSSENPESLKFEGEEAQSEDFGLA